ncbi:MAG: DUF3015 domain-containing protein [Betaproteobacteria bacterium]|nr:DUF3015 domain-containing protein [Betaproteobacteria bacterium]
MNSVKTLLKQLAPAIIALLPMQLHAQATQNKSNQKYKAPAYGMAGCGPASVIFAEEKVRNNTFLQMLGATTNLNFLNFSYTGALTSGTSNCNDAELSSAEAKKIEREAYVSMNLNELNKQAAQGDGAHLRGLAEIIGCSNEIQFELFAAVAQMEHSEIFSDSNGSNVSNRLIGKLKDSGSLESCLKSK